jgi:hypothetical protein
MCTGLPGVCFHIEKIEDFFFFFQKIYNNFEFIIVSWCATLLSYEEWNYLQIYILQINYDGFQHLNFIFSQKKKSFHYF